MFLLSPNPGAFGTLEQWIAWRDELRALCADTAGVDVELTVAELAIKDLREVDNPGPSGNVVLGEDTPAAPKKAPEHPR